MLSLIQQSAEARITTAKNPMLLPRWGGSDLHLSAAMSEHEAESRVGTTIAGAWRLDRVLGVGGMAAVYAATHASGRRAAFKILHREHANNEELRTRFLDEQRVAALIDHPDRVAVHGVAATDDGAPVLVMELLEGETLDARWRRVGRVSARAAFSIASPLLDQLAACHARGILHRDLKPDNVFLAVDGRVRLLDFGIARGGRSITGRRVAMGTPEFMAPEQARGNRERVDARCDVFAVGAILWSILSGYPLRRGKNNDETLRNAAHEPVRPLALVAPDVPIAVVAVVDHALCADPDERWSSALEMKSAVDAVLATLPLQDPILARRTHQECPTIPSTPSALRSIDTVDLGR